MIRTLRLVQGQAGPPFQDAEPLLSSPRLTVPVPGLTKHVSLTSWELHKRAPKNTFHVPQCSAKDTWYVDTWYVSLRARVREDLAPRKYARVRVGAEGRAQKSRNMSRLTTCTSGFCNRHCWLHTSYLFPTPVSLLPNRTLISFCQAVRNFREAGASHRNESGLV